MKPALKSSRASAGETQENNAGVSPPSVALPSVALIGTTKRLLYS
jgi:hypothetical protein